MPSTPRQTKLWDFTEALDLLAAWPPSDATSSRVPTRSKSPPSPSPMRKAHLYDPTTSKSSGLGDLDRLFDFLGIAHDGSSSNKAESNDSTSSSASDKSTPPSSLPDGPDLEELISKSKEVRWTDEVEGSGVARYGKPTRSSTPAQFKVRSARLAAPRAEDTSSRSTRGRRSPRAHVAALADTSEFESEPEYYADRSLPITLIPSSVISIKRSKAKEVKESLGVPPPILQTPYNPNEIRPIHTLTKKETCTKLVKKLRSRFNTESATLLQMRLRYEENLAGGNISSGGIHVFVDCSNIVIGFINQLKRVRGMDVRTHAKGGKISWHFLAMIFERGRPAARRVLVGSHRSSIDSSQPIQPDYMADAETCGYELNILERVVKNKIVTPNKKRNGAGNGYATASGYSSSSDGNFISCKAVAEQGVDEILQMKLLESLLDTAVPSTIVLASGDGAEAEYSGGFMKSVERALKHGWKVELVAWSAGLSRDYQSDDFLRRWKGRFSIILLDDFSEELLAIYAESWKGPTGV